MGFKSRFHNLISLALITSATGAAVALAHSNPREKSHPDMGETPQESRRNRVPLGSFKVGPKSNFSYELSIAPCSDKACSFQVRLLEGTEVLATADLDGAKASGPATKERVDESSGAGDPLQPDERQAAWSTGDEKQNVTTVVRAVRLTSELNGLLVDRRAGFDELKRRHELFVAVEKKLVRAWSHAEGPGPTWSTVEIVDSTRDGFQRILYFSGFHYPSDDQPDWLDVSVYEWSPTKNEIKLAPRGLFSVFAVIVGSYPAVSKAREVQASSACLGAFWVLKSEVFPKLEPGKFVLAAVSHKRDAATRESEAVKSCSPQSVASLIQTSYGQPDRK